jgi:hypothetical protein
MAEIASVRERSVSISASTRSISSSTADFRSRIELVRASTLASFRAMACSMYSRTVNSFESFSCSDIPGVTDACHFRPLPPSCVWLAFTCFSRAFRNSVMAYACAKEI